MAVFIGFPFSGRENKGQSGGFLYALGGFHSNDDGCPGWGTADSSRIRFIGDRAGTLEIEYEDGIRVEIPLVFGFTLWYHSIWAEKPAPFFDGGAETDSAASLRGALFVKGAFEGERLGVLRVALRPVTVCKISVLPLPDREGTPVYIGGFICGGEGELTHDGLTFDAGDAFFTSHTVPSDGEVPRMCETALDTICRALHTFEADFEEAPETYATDDFLPYRVDFSGTRLAAAATGIVSENMKNLVNRTDPDGFIHTSYKGAPSWRYDGFGPYVKNADSYYTDYYSRDGARAIMTLNAYGHTKKANAARALADKLMMYYPEQGLKIKGTAIPGHASVILNKPLIYSETLVPAAHWPTGYTKEAFGEGYGNLGNQETDGHGLLMLSNYLLWESLGRSENYVRENWRYINEAAEWIMWCFEHPELSFAENDLLYGETEAAMNAYTLYANVPCCLGMYLYSEMATAAGEIEKAQSWNACAARLRSGIDRGLSDGEGWNMGSFGFHHDPVPAILSDVCGYDKADMPSDWISRSEKTYERDTAFAREHKCFGRGGGIGYDHSMMTQNALLLDRMKDADGFVSALCKLSYSPRLPEPYIVPEGLCVDTERGIYRRQGDLGNLVQLAEAMKCFHIVLGISPLRGESLKVMPRLPVGWGAAIENFPVEGGGFGVDMKTEYPRGNTQSAQIAVRGGKKNVKLRFRFGPFSPEYSEARVTLNGETRDIELYPSGDSKWAWLEKEI